MDIALSQAFGAEKTTARAVFHPLCVKRILLSRPQRCSDCPLRAACSLSNGAPRTMTNNTLLVAEDCETQRFVISSLLKTLGYKIDASDNGAAAVDKFSEDPDRYICLLLDHEMPKMNGIEALRAIRLIERKCGGVSHVRIVVLTSEEDQPDYYWTDAGADKVLHKPTTAAALSEAISVASIRTSSN